jgi:hypothetical protein
MSTEPVTAAGAKAATVDDRLEQLRRQLARERSRARLTATLTLGVGAVLLCLLAWYFAYGYRELRDLAQPENLVAFGEVKLRERLPEARQKLQDEVIKGAPKWAADLSKQGLENLPTARKRLEQYALDQYEAVVKEVSVTTDEQFRSYLRSHKPMFEKHIKELETDPQLSESSLDELARSLDEQMQADMKATSGLVLETLVAMNAKLKAVHANKKLTPEAESLRRVVMLARRIQLERRDPALLARLEKPLPPKPGMKMMAKKSPSSAPAKGKTTDKAVPPKKDDKPADKKAPAGSDTKKPEAKK